MFCWKKSNSHNRLSETRKVIKNTSKPQAVVERTHLWEAHTYHSTTKKHVKACYPHSTAKEAMHELVTKPEKHKLSVLSWHFSTSAGLLPCQQSLSLYSVFPTSRSYSSAIGRVQRIQCQLLITPVTTKLTTFPVLPRRLWWGTPTGSCHFDRRHQWPTFSDWHLWQRSHSSLHCLVHLWWELLNSHMLRVLPTQALLAAQWNSNSETE